MTADAHDPQRLMVYAAEDAVIDMIGPRLRRWRDVEAFLESVLASHEYGHAFPAAPLDVAIRRRSRTATHSLAIPSHGALLIRDGSWNALTVLHELSHLVADADEPHGPDFVATELALVRRFCGFGDFGALLHAFDERGVARSDRPLASAVVPD